MVKPTQDWPNGLPEETITRAEMASFLLHAVLPAVGMVAGTPTKLVMMAVIACLKNEEPLVVENMLKDDLKGWAGHGGTVPAMFNPESLSHAAALLLSAMYHVLDGDMGHAVSELCLSDLVAKESLRSYLVTYRRSAVVGKNIRDALSA